MKVRLISYSKPDRVIGVNNVQELIAYCARVSNPDNQWHKLNNSDTSEKLIKYLMSFLAVSELFWLSGFDTLAQYAIRS